MAVDHTRDLKFPLEQPFTVTCKQNETVLNLTLSSVSVLEIDLN